MRLNIHLLQRNDRIKIEGDLINAHDELSKEWTKEKKQADKPEDRAKMAAAEQNAVILDLETDIRI